jgi:hypothetical protein
MTPFQQLWNVSDGHTVNVYSEAYSSPAFLEAHKEINSLPHDPDDDLERVVASLMMWSDVTHLASFGDASLWPVYLLFGNQSKYTQGKPTASTCHHVAYIPTVSRFSEDHYLKLLINIIILVSQMPRSNPKFNPITPTIPLAPMTRVTHVEDDDEEVFYDCD